MVFMSENKERKLISKWSWEIERLVNGSPVCEVLPIEKMGSAEVYTLKRILKEGLDKVQFKYDTMKS